MSTFADRVRRIEEANLPSGTTLQLQIEAMRLEILEEALAKGLTPEQLATQWEEEFEHARNLVQAEERTREATILASGDIEQIRRLARRKRWKVTCQYGVIRVDRNPQVADGRWKASVA